MLVAFVVLAALLAAAAPAPSATMAALSGACSASRWPSTRLASSTSSGARRSGWSISC